MFMPRTRHAPTVKSSSHEFHDARAPTDACSRLSAGTHLPPLPLPPSPHPTLEQLGTRSPSLFRSLVRSLHPICYMMTDDKCEASLDKIHDLTHRAHDGLPFPFLSLLFHYLVPLPCPVCPATPSQEKKRISASPPLRVHS
jgi:hypothetical protein